MNRRLESRSPRIVIVLIDGVPVVLVGFGACWLPFVALLPACSQTCVMVSLVRLLCPNYATSRMLLRVNSNLVIAPLSLVTAETVCRQPSIHSLGLWRHKQSDKSTPTKRDCSLGRGSPIHRGWPTAFSTILGDGTSRRGGTAEREKVNYASAAVAARPQAGLASYAE
jgi:hypothetical protein